MKIILIACLLFCFNCLGQTNIVATNDVPVPKITAIPTNEIITLDGTIYSKITIERIEPNGVTISYPLPKTGLGMKKIMLKDLPEELQKRYGLSEEEAKIYTEAKKQNDYDYYRQKAVDDKMDALARMVWQEQSEKIEAQNQLHSQELSNETTKAQAAKTAAEAAMIQAKNPSQINVIQQQQQQQQQ